MPMTCGTELIAEDRAIKAIARELQKRVAAGAVIFRTPVGMVTDMVQASHMLPGTITALSMASS